MPRPRTALTCLLLLSACGAPAEPAPRPLLVLAAASLTDVLPALTAGFPGAEVRHGFGSSSALARQILDGAPADLFVAASRRWTDELSRRDCLLGPARLLCRNRLLCVVPAGSPLLAQRPADATGLAACLQRGDRLAIGDEGVPAGDYARESLTATGDLPALRPHLVGLQDVRAVLRAVAHGEVVAGFVYATDARGSGVAELFAFDAGTHAPIEYLVAVPRTATSPPLAMALSDQLTGPAAAARLRTAGFAVEAP